LFLDLLVHQNKTIDLPRLIEMFTVNPARLLNIDAGTLSVGRPADITLIDAEREWTFDAAVSQSMSRNTPFDGWKMKGRAVQTIVGGKTIWKL
jgi:dihydroorotase